MTKIILSAASVIILFWGLTLYRPADARKELQSCEKYAYLPTNFEASDRNLCYSRKSREIVKKKGIKATITTLTEYMKTNEGRLLEGGRCHGLGHEIGLAAILSGLGGEQIAKECADFCGFGCLNGAAHAFVLSGSNVAEMEEFCDVPGTTPDIRRGCYHGIGHGVINYNKLDIAKALKMCDDLSSEEARYECGHASIMEPEMIPARPLETIPDDIPRFCDSLREVYRNSCFEFAGFLEYIRTNRLDGASNVCNRVPLSFQKQCGERLGEALFLALRSNAQEIINVCSLAQRENAEMTYGCIFGAVRASLNSVDASTAELGVLLCKTAAVQFQAKCFADLGKNVAELYGEEVRRKICDKLLPQEQKECLKLMAN